MDRQTKRIRAGVMIAVLLLAVGCAAQKAYRKAELNSRRDNWDRAVLGYSKALALDPGNTRYSVALTRAKLKASAQHFEKGKRYASAAQWDLAVAEFQETLLLNPGNQHAATELKRALARVRRRDEGPSAMEILKEKARRQKLAPPKLDPSSNIPIVMNFRKVAVGKIFEAVGKASGINFLFDDKTDLKKEITVDIGDVTMENALDILMLQTKNFFKVIDEHTLLVAPDTRQKRQEYQDQVIRTFYLSNGDTKQVVALLRSLLSSRQIAENPDLNSVTIKDTPDKVAIAEMIINANDKSKGEVIVDVELLEINRTVAKNLGIDLSSKTLALSYRGGDQSVPLNNLRVLKQKGNWSIGVIPSVIVNFLKSDSETKTIAKPQVRVSEGEKAKILIGDRVPIPTTAFNTSQTIGGNIVPITSFTYQNVGITVQIEPRVHHNKEVTLKVSVEVSQIASYVEGSGGQRQPIIGTRQIETVIRLRDGETNLLAGLIRREEQDSRTGVPGLSEIPGLGRLLSNSSTSGNETDIVMTLTPHIVRIPDITEKDMATLWVGTEENMRLRGPVSNALGVSPFRSPEGGEGEVAKETAAGTTGGSTAVVAPSEEVERERESREAAGAATKRRGETGPAGETEEQPAASEPKASGSPAPDNSGAQEEEKLAGPARVLLVPSTARAAVGDVITVEVRMENGRNVGSVPFHLRYNRQVLEFLPPASEGPFLGSDGTGTVFLASDAAGGGEVVVGLSRMGGERGATGSGRLAAFRFRAVNPGSCGFAFTGASVKDPRARTLSATFVPAAVRVE